MCVLVGGKKVVKKKEDKTRQDNSKAMMRGHYKPGAMLVMGERCTKGKNSHEDLRGTSVCFGGGDESCEEKKKTCAVLLCVLVGGRKTRQDKTREDKAK